MLRFWARSQPSQFSNPPSAGTASCNPGFPTFLTAKLGQTQHSLLTLPLTRENMAAEFVRRFQLALTPVGFFVASNILRAGVAEFLGFLDTPKPVVINEALEIARKFSSPESVNFLNGVLDSIARELDKTAPAIRK